MRYTQPQGGPLQIDRNNPLARGLVSYMPLTGKSNADIVDGNAWAPTGGPVYDGAPRGLGLRAKGASASYVMRPAPAAITASTTQPVTFRFRLYLHSALTTAVLSWGNIPQDGAPRFYVRLNGSSQLQIYASGYIVNCPVVAEREYIVTHTSNGATRLTYLNGVLVSTDSVAWSGNANNFYLGIGYDGVQPTTDHLLSDFAVWNRALSPSEVKADADNPYQIVKSPQRAMFAAAPAAGGATTYSYTSAGGFVFSGAAPGVRSVTKAAAGGLQLSGAAPQARGVSKAPAGGILLSGAAPQTRGRAVTPAGGLALSGASGIVRSIARAAVGGLKFAGTAALSATAQVQARVITPVGGLLLAGAAAVSRATSRAVSGGITFSGHAVKTAGAAGALLASLLPIFARRRRRN